MMKRPAMLSVILVCLLGLFAGSSVSRAADTIKVGIVDSYSGPAAVFGNDMRDGFSLGVNEINAKGGVLGRKFEILEPRDEKFEPNLALSMAKDLVMREKVDLLMGTISSASALAISTFAKQEKVPFFVTYSKSKGYPARKDTGTCLHFSRIRPWPERQQQPPLRKNPIPGTGLRETTWNTGTPSANPHGTR